MKNEELLQHSKKIKSDIKLWLEQSKLINLLSNYGVPSIIGSYALDLMYGPDLDIVVKTNNPRESSIGTVNKFIDNKIVQKLEFGDFVNYAREARPKGYIIVLKPYINGVKWEVEIWFLEDVKKHLDHIDIISQRLNDKKKLEILKLKYQRDLSGESKHSLDSYTLYKKVLGDFD